MPAKVRSENDVRALTTAEKEEIIRRFHARFDAAIGQAPPTKAWIRKALSRGGAPRCPVRLKRLSLDIILRYEDALADLFCEYPDDAVFAQAYDLFVGRQASDQPQRVESGRGADGGGPMDG